MASSYLQQPLGIATLSKPTCLLKKPLDYGQFLSFPKSTHFLAAPKLRFLDFAAHASAKMTMETAEMGSNKADSKVRDLAFVAGATGRVGSRTVRELLKLGFGVRAGVRSAERAGSLVQSVKEMKLDGENKPVEKLEIVECDLEQPDTIRPAIRNASVVICCIGASEKEIFNITGPYRIDYQATKNLVDAATKANVDHFILVSSLGTNKVGFPAAILNLFWGVLVWKRKAEEALIASGIPYTIVRPGGMERPTDAYKLTHNIVLSPEDTLFGGNVSNLQVAELMACMAKNRSLSFCKVVEVIAQTTAPLTPMEELLAKIPSQRPPPADVDMLKDTDVPAQPDSVYPRSVSAEAPPTAEAKATGTQPLSPYTAYYDLKPPSTPTPTAPTGRQETSASEPTAKTAGAIAVPDGVLDTKPTPHPPYVVYEDLKPPSSPGPFPRDPKVAALNVSTEVNNRPIAVTPNIQNVSSQITSPHSPYMTYEDLKPPSSPSPSSPKRPAEDTGSEGSSTSINSTAQAQTAEKPRPKPLSPFTMYEDLKPPTSPIPSPKKM